MTYAAAKAALIALASSRTCRIGFAERIVDGKVVGTDIVMHVDSTVAIGHATYELALAELRVRLGQPGVPQDQEPD